MFMNQYQEYIKDMLNEYGVLLKRQLLTMINCKFHTQKETIDGYVAQMCRFSDFEEIKIGSEEGVRKKGVAPDFNVIRAVDVMLPFMGKVIHHRKSKDFVTLAFIVRGGENKHDKAIYVVPVIEGNERTISLFVQDKFIEWQSELVLFLLEDKEQMHLINVACKHVFAILDKYGVEFLKPNAETGIG